MVIHSHNLYQPGKKDPLACCRGIQRAHKNNRFLQLVREDYAKLQKVKWGECCSCCGPVAKAPPSKLLASPFAVKPAPPPRMVSPKASPRGGISKREGRRLRKLKTDGGKAAEDIGKLQKWEEKNPALLSKFGKYMVKAGNARRRGQAGLMNACKTGQLHLARKSVYAPNNADVNEADDEGMTPLMTACRHAMNSENKKVRNGALVEFLLEEQADAKVSLSNGSAGDCNALYYACIGGSLAIIRMLVFRGADLGPCDSDGRTSLMLTAQGGSVLLVAWVLWNLSSTLGVSEEEVIVKTDNNGWTAIHHSSQANCATITRFLMNRGARVVFPAQKASKHQIPRPLLLAGMEGNVDIFAMLQRHDTNALSKKEVESLHEDIIKWEAEVAAESSQHQLEQSKMFELMAVDGDSRGMMKAVDRLLASAAFEVPPILSGRLLYLEQGTTPLLSAATSSAGNARIVELLLSARAELPGPTDDKGCNALHRAAQNGSTASVSVFKALLEGLKNLTGHVRRNVLSSHSGAVQTLMLAAAGCNSSLAATEKFKLVASLHLNEGATVSQRLWQQVDGYGRTALHIVAENGNLDLVKWIASNMDIEDAPEITKSQPLCRISKTGDNSLESAVGCRTWAGATPLMLAAAALREDVVQALIDSGAELTVKDKSGSDVNDYLRKAVAGKRRDRLMIVLQENSATPGAYRSDSSTSMHMTASRSLRQQMSNFISADSNASGSTRPTLFHKTMYQMQTTKIATAARATVSAAKGVLKRGNSSNGLAAATPGSITGFGVRIKVKSMVHSIRQLNGEDTTAVAKKTKKGAVNVAEDAGSAAGRTPIPTKASDRVVSRMSFETDSYEEAPRPESVQIWKCKSCDQQNTSVRKTCAFCYTRAESVQGVDVMSPRNEITIHSESDEAVTYKLEVLPEGEASGPTGKRFTAPSYGLFVYNAGDCEGRVCKLRVHCKKFVVEDEVDSSSPFATNPVDREATVSHINVRQDDQQLLKPLLALANRAKGLHVIELGKKRRPSKVKDDGKLLSPGKPSPRGGRPSKAKDDGLGSPTPSPRRSKGVSGRTGGVQNVGADPECRAGCLDDVGPRMSKKRSERTDRGSPLSP